MSDEEGFNTASRTRPTTGSRGTLDMKKGKFSRQGHYTQVTSANKSDQEQSATTFGDAVQHQERQTSPTSDIPIMNINAISSFHKIKSDIQGNFRNHQVTSAFYRTGHNTTTSSQLEIAKVNSEQKADCDKGLVGARVWGNKLLRNAGVPPMAPK